MANILASSIKDKSHLKAFDNMMAERFSEIDLSILIPNLFDTVPAEALPYLAKQYGLLGYNGWRYALTEQQQRDLLKNGITLKKFKGTMWSIREALKLINIAPVDIRKDPYILYCNGVFATNGHFTCGGPNPFNFEISIDASVISNITVQIATDMLALINEYKAARDLLLAVNVTDTTQTDAVDVSDSLMVFVTTPPFGGTTTNYLL